MAPGLLPLSVLVLLMAAMASPASAASVEASELASELAVLRDKSRDGVIVLDDAGLKRFTAAKQRGYSLYVFLTARQVESEPSLAMPRLRSEFGLLASAARAGPAPDAAFFVQMTFEDSPRVFHVVQAQQVGVWRGGEGRRGAARRTRVQGADRASTAHLACSTRCSTLHIHRSPRARPSPADSAAPRSPAVHRFPPHRCPSSSRSLLSSA